MGDDHPNTATSLNNLAFVYESQGRYGEAEPLLQQALEIRRRVLGNDHPNTATSLNNLAGLYWGQGNLSQAVAHFSQGLDIEEVNLASILATGSERRKRAYLATVSATTEATLSLHLQFAPNNADAAHLALTTLLRRKGRILDATGSGLEALRQNLIAADQQLLDQLNDIRSQLANLIFTGPGNGDSAQYHQQVAQLKGQADQLESQLSQRSAAFRIEAQPVTIEAVQQQIPANAVLVELVRYRPLNAKATGTELRVGSARYAAYVLQRRSEPKWVDLGETEAIDQAAFRFRQSLGQERADARRSARKLDSLLMQPIRPLLGKARHLLISPDGQLSLIPFAALRDEQQRFLVEQYAISYLTAGRDLLKLPLSSASREGPLLVANADFGAAQTEPAGGGGRGRSVPQSLDLLELLSQIFLRWWEAIGTSPLGRLASQQFGLGRSLGQERNFQDLEFEPLPGTKQEADAIAPLLPNATVLMEDRATEAAVKQVRGPSILHITSHGFFLEDVPLAAPADYGGLRSFAFEPDRAFIETVPRPGATAPAYAVENPLLRSGLALAGFNQRKSGENDGALMALEVSGLDLYGTQLVVLSACETGVGEVANGEGVYGLRRALVLAGSRSQVMSLWQVHDLGTKEFMVRYYQQLQKGAGRSEALRQVQLRMLQGDQYRHPYYWAAFIPSGDWRPMSLE